MSRVLLMVQGAGDKRPKCVAWWESAWSGALMALINGDPFASVRFHGLKKAQRSGNPWWLVQCDNAEAGRVIITNAEWGRVGLGVVAGGKLMERKRFPEANYLAPEGRILATGGAREGGEG